MDSITRLIAVAEIYAAAVDVERTTVSWRLFGDSKKLDALASGRDIQVRRYETALRWLSDNWPESAIWPDHVIRPVNSSAPRAALDRNMPEPSPEGTENPDANVSRTNEPGSVPAAVPA